MEANKVLSETPGIVSLRQIFVEARNRLDLSQADVAKACEITQGAISQFEAGISGLTSATLEKLRAYILRVAEEKAAAVDDPSHVANAPKLYALSRLLNARSSNFLAKVERDLQERMGLERELRESNQKIADIDKRINEYVSGLEAKAADYDKVAAENAALKAKLARLTGKKSKAIKPRKKRR